MYPSPLILLLFRLRYAQCEMYVCLSVRMSSYLLLSLYSDTYGLHDCIYFKQMEEYAKAEESSRKARVSFISHNHYIYRLL